MTFKPLKEQPKAITKTERFRETFQPVAEAVTEWAETERPKRKRLWRMAAEAYAPLGEYLGIGLATPYINRQSIQIMKQEMETLNTLKDSYRRAKTPEQQEKIRRILANWQPSEPIYKVIPGMEATAGQIFGAGITTAAMPVGMALGGALPGAGLLPRAAIRGGVPGAMFGMGRALQEKARPEEIAISAGIGFGVGTIVYAGMEKLQELFRKVSIKLYESKIRPTKAELRHAYRFDEKSLAEKAINKGYTGTMPQIKAKTETDMLKFETELQSILKKSDAKVTKVQIKNSHYVKDLLKFFKRTPGETHNVDKFLTMLDETLPDNIPLIEANEIKRNLYKVVGEKAYITTKDVATTKEMQRAISRGIRELIEKKTKDEVVRNLNIGLGTAYEIRERVIEAMASEARKNMMPSIGRALFGRGLFGMAGGGYAGYRKGGIPGAVGGAILGGITEEALVGTGWLQTKTGAIANMVSKAASPAIRTALIGLALQLGLGPKGEKVKPETKKIPIEVPEAMPEEVKPPELTLPFKKPEEGTFKAVTER